MRSTQTLLGLAKMMVQKRELAQRCDVYHNRKWDEKSSGQPQRIQRRFSYDKVRDTNHYAIEEMKEF